MCCVATLLGVVDSSRLGVMAFGFGPHGWPLCRRGMEAGVNGRSGPSHGLRMPRQTRDQRHVLGCPLLRAALALSSNEQCCPTKKLEES